MNYKEKYLKYKTKYLRLKNLIGGSKLYPALYEKIKNEGLWGEDEEILTDDFKIKNKLWNTQNYKADSAILVSDAFLVLVIENGISEEEFFDRLSKTRIGEIVLEIIKKSNEGNNNIDNKIIEDDVLKKYILKVANSELLTTILLQIGISRPFKIGNVRQFLESKDFSSSNIIEDISCLEKTRNECLGNCRWQPIPNDLLGEDGETCYRIDYNPKPRKRKPLEKIEVKLDSISE